ncbi:MAG: acyl-CoA dehydrogenase family protein [Planctomycetaceae bacterium]|nr:acyl-CoA dehydrogenase family protein [Planctomycetaceae bacterium]
MATLTDLEKQQIAEAEEILFSGPNKEGFAKDLFFGKFRASSIRPFPSFASLPAEIRNRSEAQVARVREFCQTKIDAAKIDREALIPNEVIRGLGDLGVLGMTVSSDCGGQGLSQYEYCRVMEIIGGHCASTGVFVNAHHSIGLRALELFGTQEQKKRWMRPLASGEKIAAFALTEPEAGSDASNVQTVAVPDADGRGFTLTGEKRWITNGGIADVLTVMARTPDPNNPKGKITAFLVTPDMPGFKVLETRMEKCGIRGTATGRFSLENVYVPRENILGPIGKGLKVALTVLDFGRTTFGACCTGTAKYCLEQMMARAKSRRQFGKNLADFELVKGKISEAAADIYAMESATYHTAALIDSGADDYMVETAMIKVFASDQLWRIVNDTLQIWGGAGFFTDQPFERMMRDARLNLIGEGANDVLRCFIAMVGLRGVGLELKGIYEGVKGWRPQAFFDAGKMLRRAPAILCPHDVLRPHARELAKQIGAFAQACQTVCIRHQEGILNRQFVQARIGDMATELFMASCVFARVIQLLEDDIPDSQQQLEIETGVLYLNLAKRRNNERLKALAQTFDDQSVKVADLWLDGAK